MDINFAILFPILFPMICGVLVMWLPIFKRRAAMVAFITAVMLVNAAVVFMLLIQPGLRLEAFQFTGKLTLLFKIDSLSCLFTAMVSVVWIIVGMYAFEYMKHEGHEQRFFLFYLLTEGALIGLGFAGNYMTLYLFFELMTLVSVPLVLHSMTGEAIAAALKYLFYSIAGASLSLVGFVLMYMYGGSIEFIPGGTLDPALYAGHEKVLLAGAMLAIIGFGAKAGMFPLHAWLPTAHPVAPAPASAVLSGVITKAGVLAVLRVVYYQFGAGFLRGTPVQYAWMTLALITVFMGSMLAFKETLLKKRLAWSSVSQVSYVLFGLSVMDAAGMTGAMLHVVFHCIVKNGLFLVAGAIIYMTHKTRVSELHGIGKQLPVTMCAFTLLSITLVGIPPTSAFLSKWYLAQGALRSGVGLLSLIGPIVLLLSAMLTAAYLLSISINGFFHQIDRENVDAGNREPGSVMLIPIIALTTLAVGYGIFPGRLMTLISVLTKDLF